MLNIYNQGSNNHKKDAGRIRDILMEHVTGCGSVDWQEQCSKCIIEVKFHLAKKC